LRTAIDARMRLDSSEFGPSCAAVEKENVRTAPSVKPAKDSALDILAEPLAGSQQRRLAYLARLGPLCGKQPKQNSRNQPHSGPVEHSALVIAT
jgi:hypothetical protein